MCQQFCPVHTPIPKVISLFNERRLTEAGQLLFENNPLALVCSSVCDHSQQCFGHCVLGRKGSAIHFYDIEKYIADYFLDHLRVGNASYGKKEAVAVIGSGPAGLTAAMELANYGYRVTIFEKEPHIGGRPYDGIPEIRLPRNVLERYHESLYKMGIQIRLNTAIGEELTVENLLNEGYAAVFIGTGACKPKKRMLLKESGLENKASGSLMSDEYGKTARRGVFAAVDFASGEKNVVYVVEATKHVVSTMVNYLAKERCLDSISQKFVSCHSLVKSQTA